jgi:hypothetical protein
MLQVSVFIKRLSILKIFAYHAYCLKYLKLNTFSCKEAL